MEKFETNDEMIYSLIIDDLEQTISPADQQLLNDWRNSDSANEKTYQEFAHVQRNIDKLYDKNNLDSRLSWQSLDRKLSGQNTGRVKRLSLWYKIAAAVVVILSIGYYFISANKYEIINTTESASVRQLVLPDGTELVLNTGAVVKYDKKNFNADRRLILEKGEVFVHVVKHSGNQFRIKVDEIEIQDIGTSFTVSKNEQLASVVVEEGKVAMKHAAGDQVLLTEGMRGLFVTGTKQLSSMVNTDLNYKAWVDKKFTFSEMPIEQVALQLQNVYKIPLDIKGEELKIKKLTATLHYQTLDSVLAVISASLQCKIIKGQNTYVLSGEQ